MRSFAKRIDDLVKDGVNEDEMKKAKQEMLSEVGLFHSTYTDIAFNFGLHPSQFNLGS